MFDCPTASMDLDGLACETDPVVDAPLARAIVAACEADPRVQLVDVSMVARANDALLIPYPWGRIVHDDEKGQARQTLVETMERLGISGTASGYRQVSGPSPAEGGITIWDVLPPDIPGVRGLGRFSFPSSWAGPLAEHLSARAINRATVLGFGLELSNDGRFADALAVNLETGPVMEFAGRPGEEVVRINVMLTQLSIELSDVVGPERKADAEQGVRRLIEQLHPAPSFVVRSVQLLATGQERAYFWDRRGEPVVDQRVDGWASHTPPPTGAGLNASSEDLAGLPLWTRGGRPRP